MPFLNASDFGFSTQATGLANSLALQKAVDLSGTILIDKPGEYLISQTIYVGSHTSLTFSNGVFLKKSNEVGDFSHVFLNKGALTKTFDENIVIDGLSIIVGGMDVRTFKDVFGLHGQLAFFYIKDLKITRFRCFDLGPKQYGIHVCTFEDIHINDVKIKGDKDGVHLGRGKRFYIGNGSFETYDDAIALNAHDYDVGNPELGWIEDGVVENCHDLPDGKAKVVGYFCRILAGAWTDWFSGMQVQKSDTVVSKGRLYRVSAPPDETIYTSLTAPTHEQGTVTHEEINWVMVQDDVTYTAGVRNVIFRNIFISKPRIAFSIHFDSDKYSRSYYPNSPTPSQEQLSFDNVRMLHKGNKDFLSINTPVDLMTITNSVFEDNSIHFHSNKAMQEYLPTKVNLIGCIFKKTGPFNLLVNEVENKLIELRTTASAEMSPDFKALVVEGDGKVTTHSDLRGLKVGAV